MRGWRYLPLVAVLVVAERAEAQVGWDAPLLLPPRAEPGMGIFLADMAGGGLGLIGTWRSPARSYGLRLGIAEERDDDLAVFGGLDFTGNVTRAGRDFPLDVDWVFGAGLSVGDDVLVSLPLGLTAGHTFNAEGARFTPYATPRIVFDAWFGDGDGRRDSQLTLDFSFDVGLDMRLTGGSRGGVTVRFGATLGDREALAIGLVF